MESTYHYYQILSVLTSFLGITLAITLWSRASIARPANAFLSLLVLTYTLFSLPGLMDAFGILEEVHHVIRLNAFAGTLLGPLTYLYCRSTTQNEPFRVQKVWFHFIPFILDFIRLIPTMTLPPAEKLEIYHQMVKTGQPEQLRLVLVVKIAITTLYIIVSIRVVRRYLKHLKNTNSSIDSSFHRWLLFVCFFFLVPVACALLVRATSTEFVSVPIAATVLASFIFIVYFTLTTRPKFFYEFPSQIATTEPPAELAEYRDESQERPKYRQSKLQEADKENYERDLLAFMIEKQPFLNPELTLVRLAKQLQIPAHHLSQLINERLECHFIDFVNGYRIEEAQRMLKAPEHEHHTIISIAQDAGFNSKTAFYTAFKRRVGCTPSQYRKGATAES